MRSASRESRLAASRFAAVFCLLLFFYLALSTALAKAPTVDEPLHLTRAAALRQAGDLSLQGEHVPFSHRLAGLFLGTEPLPDLDALSSWSGGDRRAIASELLWQSEIDVERTLFLARLPIIWLGFLLGAFVGSWALAWQGRPAMGVALILFATSPNLIAHSALVTTDLAAAATYFAAVYAWWRFWHYGRRRWWLLTAVLLGLALATKLTAILLLPVLLLLALVSRSSRRGLWRAVWIWAALLPPALVILWLAYGLQMGPIAGWPFVLPAPAYLESWRSVLSHVQEGHLSFFLGELAETGWRSYFPVTFLIKTPLVTLLLLLIALAVVIRRRDLWRTSLFLLIPVGALFAAAMASNLNIGYRHILPALPFLLVLATTAVLFLRRWQITRILLGLGLVWVVISALRQNPHHLAYFNEAVGGMAQGYRYLGDSNLDWGQDINLLADEISGLGGTWIVSYAGTNDPGYYGIDDDVLLDISEARDSFPLANPQPGRYAISANHLQGQVADADFFDWFRRRQPVDQLGGSILIYEVKEQVKGEWIAQCLDPLPLLAAEEAEIIVDSGSVRQLVFDCRQSLILADEKTPGWLLLPQADRWWFEEQLPAVENQLQLVFRHDAAAGLPSFDVYFWPGLAGESLTDGWIENAENEAGTPISLPRPLNKSAEVAAYQVAGSEWFVAWEINAAAPEPLTLLAHLYARGAETPLVGDSLGFSSEQWQAGDWLMQRYAFPDQEDVLFLQTGVYNYQTLQRVGETVNLPRP